MKPWLKEDSGLARWAAHLMIPIERWSKGAAFGCQMCGQCILHSTGMTCPMTCPKNLRNGPCGGVRPNGHCEVYPEMRCRWVQAIETAPKLPLWQEHPHHLQPPVNWRLQGTSSWINLLTGKDRILPKAWEGAPDDHH
ncbi:MAG: methylenetetrahydrofolate reductase C-terminal domain-containing protein [Anaerolineae bacterium]